MYDCIKKIVPPIKSVFWSYLLSSMLFLALPYFMFLVYMAHHGFFSYEFFNEGKFALITFFYLNILLFLIFPFILFSSVFFFTRFIQPREATKVKLTGQVDLRTKLRKLLQARRIIKKLHNKKYSNTDRREKFLRKKIVMKLNALYILIFTFSVNVIFSVMILSLNYPWGLYLSYLFLSTIMFIYLNQLITASAKSRLTWLIIFICSIIGFTVIQTGEVIKIVDRGLNIFGVGGGLNVTLYKNNNNHKVEKLEGKLILLTTKNIFMRPIVQKNYLNIAMNFYPIVSDAMGEIDQIHYRKRLLIVNRKKYNIIIHSTVLTNNDIIDP